MVDNIGKCYAVSLFKFFSFIDLKPHSVYKGSIFAVAVSYIIFMVFHFKTGVNSADCIGREQNVCYPLTLSYEDRFGAWENFLGASWT